MHLSDDPRVGTEVAGYRIESLLGRGGMSVVYLAEDPRLKRKVALKLLAARLAEDESFRDRFLRESELAASIDHPNIVPVYEAGTAEGLLFIAMRYVEGRDLSERLDRGCLDPGDAIGILAQMASALDAAHARGLVHRDVKPSNVLLDRGARPDGSDHVYLADFGLTSRASDGTGVDDGPFMGTIDYVAPEQIAGGEIDGRADVYSLACVLYECLVGQPPFRRDSELAIVFAHLEAEPPAPSARRTELPAALDAVVVRALAKEPQERYASCRELAQAALAVMVDEEGRRRVDGASRAAAARGGLSELDAQLPAEPLLRTRHLTNLPTQLTPLVGRRRELAAAGALLRKHRMLTLTGPGGTGKTRLALQLAADAVEEFRDSVFWVPLAALHDPDAVALTIAQSVGATDGLAEHLRDQQALLLLDNFEQVAEAAPVLVELLHEAPRLKLLVTSREPLRIAGEQRFGVPPLTEAEAITLFRERARAVAPEFEPDEHVGEICRRLDCLPLALELAAARLSTLSPEAMLARLQRRLPFLTGGGRDLPERQRTLRATIEWSYELLDHVEKSLFARLAVFTGGFTLDAAEEVCHAELDTLQSLIEKNLVRRDGERCTMLETIREFAWEVLQAGGRADALVERHTRYYAGFASDLDRAAFGERARLALRLEPDVDNFRSVLGNPVADPELKLRLAAELTPLWDIHGRALEGRRWIDQAFAAAPAASAPLRALALQRIGVLAVYSDQVDDGELALEQSLELFRALGDELGVAVAQLELGVAAWRGGDSLRAKALFEGSRDVFARLEDEGWEAGAAHYLGELEIREGDIDRGEQLLHQGLAFYRRVDASGAVAAALCGLGDAALRRSSFEEAASCYREALAIVAELHLERGVASGLAGLAAAAAGQAEEARAGLLWGAVEQLERRLGFGLGARERAEYERVIDRCADAPGFRAARQRGQTLTVDEAIEQALLGD